MADTDIDFLRRDLLAGQVIPAVPLALESDGTWSRKHQRALVRYYLEAGAGGLAVGVHSTQFEIRDPAHALFEPVLEFCSAEIERRGDPARPLVARPLVARPLVRIAGVCGRTGQAEEEAAFARSVGYDAALLGLSAMGDADDRALVSHCRAVAAVLPLVGFYLQPAIGGRSYSHRFWREFLEIEGVVAIKVAPFDRYATLEVVRALAESGRDDVALYTGNDDNIIHDLVTPFSFDGREIRFSGGLLGQWAVGTKRAVQLLRRIREGSGDAASWARENAALTDFNAAIFDPAHRFAGCLPGIHEVLRRDGLMPSIRCLDPGAKLSPGQRREIDRVLSAYPEWQDVAFIRENLDCWLEPA